MCANFVYLISTVYTEISFNENEVMEKKCIGNQASFITTSARYDLNDAFNRLIHAIEHFGSLSTVDLFSFRFDVILHASY